jgi:cobalt-zinc-cadmium efflux system protein
MSNNHNYSNNLFLTIGLNLALTVGEFVVGTFTGSLALISDATHNSVDIVTLLITYIADKVSKNKADYNHSYGFKRVGILASLLNSVILAAIAAFIFISAFGRLQNPEPIDGIWVAVVAFVAVFVNGFSAYLVSKNKKDLNFRAAYLNMFFDMVASIGALVGGLVILVTKWYWVDSLVGILIGVLLLRSSVEILREALDILLEAVPKNIDMDVVKKDILAHECVYNVVDLHIWSINAEDMVLTSVIEINPECLGHLDKDIEDLKADLRNRHHIYHQTIEARIQAVEHVD